MSCNELHQTGDLLLRRERRAIVWLLAIGGCVVSGSVIWASRPLRETMGTAQGVVPNGLASANEVPMETSLVPLDVKPFREANLWHAPPPPPKPEPKRQPARSVIRPMYALIGIRKASGGNGASAVLYDQRAHTVHEVSEGNTIAALRIERITSDRVVLFDGRTRYELKLHRERSRP